MPTPLLALAVALTAFTDLPPVTRTGAQEAARRELSKQIYHRYDEPLTLRVLRAVGRWLDDALAAVASRAPGGIAGLVALVALVVVLVLVLRMRLGPVRRAAQVHPVFDGRLMTAADHRAAAEARAAEGRWAEAVRERLRAIVRELETRGVIDTRPGRTADEVAREAGAALPDLATDLTGAARAFDEVWYGGRPATPEAYDGLRRLDDDLRSRRLAVAGVVPQ